MAWKFYGTCLLLWNIVLRLPGPHPGVQLFPVAGSQAPGDCLAQRLPCARGCSSNRPRFRLASLEETLRWAPFLSDEKEGKESPKAGPSPALWNPPRGTGCPCVLLVSALGPVGSHRWHGNSTERACFSGTLYFNCQGLTLVCNCSQLPEAWLPVTA